MENEADGFHHLIIVFNYKRPAYFPWRTTRDECANYATRFMVAGGAPIVAAVSFPGAGNTWLRYITEVLSGIFTGSVYHDETLALKGFWGERDGYRQGTTIIQKTHSFPLLPDEVKDGIYNGQEFRFLVPAEPRKVVVLLRNPWESLLALRHYHAAGHTGFANMAFFKGPEWANFTSERAQLWVQLYTAWLSLPNTHVHVVHYEHLQHGLEKEAKRLVKFLGLTLDYGRLECLIRYPEGRFRRPKYPKHLQGYNFPSASANILRDGMGSVDSLLRQGGHPSLPTHLYSFTPPIQDT
ncbi:sialate:O-sulfotransferase 2-like [Macrobrachium nipponense]|uniref:sialate:O-sulfotransferase 2-like n=1 Tax=Macrobrachium nipponense TaxID=159736 RepID=UPI0030C7E73F